MYPHPSDYDDGEGFDVRPLSNRGAVPDVPGNAGRSGSGRDVGSDRSHDGAGVGVGPTGEPVPISWGGRDGGDVYSGGDGYYHRYDMKRRGDEGRGGSSGRVEADHHGYEEHDDAEGMYGEYRGGGAGRGRLVPPRGGGGGGDGDGDGGREEEDDRYPAYPSKYRRTAEDGWAARQTHDRGSDDVGRGGDARRQLGNDTSRYLESQSMIERRGNVLDRRDAATAAVDKSNHPAGREARGRGGSTDVNTPPPGSQWHSGGQKGQWRAVSPSNVSRSDVYSPPGPAARASSAPAAAGKAAGLLIPAGSRAWKPTVGWQMRRSPPARDSESSAKEQEVVKGAEESGGGGSEGGRGGRENTRDGSRPRAVPPPSSSPSSPPSHSARNGGGVAYARGNGWSGGGSGGGGRNRDGPGPPSSRAAPSPGYSSSPSSRAAAGAAVVGRQEGSNGGSSSRDGGHGGAGGRGDGAVSAGGAIAVLPPPPSGPGPALRPAHLHQHAENYASHRRHHYHQQQEQAHAAELAERYRQGGKKARFGGGGRAAGPAAAAATAAAAAAAAAAAEARGGRLSSGGDRNWDVASGPGGLGPSPPAHPGQVRWTEQEYWNGQDSGAAPPGYQRWGATMMTPLEQ
ncbi:unnamed protein product, partial [Hapterophycus canaliculatus]